MQTAYRPADNAAERRAKHRVFIKSGDKVRSFAVRPWIAIPALAVIGTFSVLYIGATAFLFFHDDILNASLSRQARMQRQYEDRIATLRSDLDRLTSRQLLNQEAVETEMSRITNRQSALDARQDSIATLSQAVRAAGVPVDAAPADNNGGSAAATPPADTPASDSDDTDPQATGSIKPAPPAPAEASAVAPLSFNFAPAGDKAGLSVESPTLATVGQSLDHLAHDQVAFVDAVATDVASRSDRMATVLASLGQRVPPSRAETADVGGPLVEIDENADPATFRSTVDLVSAEVDRFVALRRLAGELPLSRPLAESIVTSGFGARLDPFLGRPAIHPGIDFAALEGSPAHATAAGTVIVAGANGGYGNEVEIDHGNGITTRYGHLSEIDVQIGQVVSKGAVVGKTGSTGRSTGPHLHYEVRVDGAAVDPATFINAGHRIASLL
jgi:murein DD-endopeptidase MepM/ murein hydrolase activator NlpD